MSGAFGELREAAFEEPLLGSRLSELEGACVRSARLIVAAEASQQAGARPAVTRRRRRGSTGLRG